MSVKYEPKTVDQHCCASCGVDLRNVDDFGKIDRFIGNGKRVYCSEGCFDDYLIGIGKAPFYNRYWF